MQIELKQRQLDWIITSLHARLEIMGRVATDPRTSLMAARQCRMNIMYIEDTLGQLIDARSEAERIAGLRVSPAKLSDNIQQVKSTV